MKFFSRLSLQGMLIFILAALLLPALALGTLGYFDASAQEDNLAQVRLQVNQINQLINQSVSSPFYLSPRVFEPCDPATLDQINLPANWQIKYQTPHSGRAACEWVYLVDGARTAADGWSDYDRKLTNRIYYQSDGSVLATDEFFTLDESGQLVCVKQRRYETLNVDECYSEAGELISIDPRDNLFSPLPPMLYWFSYR